MGWRAVPDRYLNRRSSLVHHSVLLPAVFAAAQLHIAPQGSIPGETVILGAYIPRRFPQLISSVLGSSSHPSHGSLFHQDERTSKQQEEGKARGQAGGWALALVLALVSSLVSAGGVNGVSFPSAGSVSGSRFPIPVARQGMAIGSTPPSRQASRQGRHAPVPPLVSAGGKPSATPLVSPPRGPSSERRASKQGGSSRPPASAPFRSSCRPVACPRPGGQSMGRESKTPRSPYRGTGRKAFRRSIARGYCNRRRPSYRRRYTWQVPAPGDSSRRR